MNSVTCTPRQKLTPEEAVQHFDRAVVNEMRPLVLEIIGRGYDRHVQGKKNHVERLAGMVIDVLEVNGVPGWQVSWLITDLFSKLRGQVLEIAGVEKTEELVTAELRLRRLLMDRNTGPKPAVDPKATVDSAKLGGMLLEAAKPGPDDAITGGGTYMALGL